MPELASELLGLLAARKGHFMLESGHHGDLWLDLDLLFLRPERLRPFAQELATRLERHEIEAVCGPLIGGALLAQMIAAKLDVDFVYAERSPRASPTDLYPVDYQVAPASRSRIRGQRIAVVDDAINAGSAVRATLADLTACGARPAAIGAMLVLGSSANDIAATAGIPLESLASLSSSLWIAAECPLCASGVPLENA